MKRYVYISMNNHFCVQMSLISEQIYKVMNKLHYRMNNPKTKSLKSVLPSRKHRRNHTYKRRVKGEIILKIDKKTFFLF